MKNNSIIYAVGIHTGGGLSILKEFLKNKRYFFYLDSRLDPIHYKDIKNYKIIKKNFINLIILYFDFFKKESNFFFINGIPPLFNLKKNIFVLFQNLNIFPPKKNILNIIIWIFSFDFLRYINFKLGYKNVLTWFVLSDIAKIILEQNIERCAKIVKLDFFNLTKNKTSKIKKFDFIYPADLKKHKNHKRVILALLDLAKKNIKPSFLFTLTKNEKIKINFDNLKEKINIHNFDDQNNRLSFLRLLKQSKCLFFPSFNETIGLPILEGFNYDLIIASSNREYSKQFVTPDYTFNPESVVSIKKNIKKIFFIKKKNSKSKKVKLRYFLNKKHFFEKIVK